MASSTPRVIGPSLSSDQHSAMAPLRGTRPNVGRNPVTPHRMLGATMLPPVSLPMANPTNAAATAAPGPALDPDAPSSSNHGFIVWPPNQMSLSASAPSDNLAISTAPASCSRATTTESFGGHALAERLGTVGGRNPRGVEQVFHPERNPVQRAAIFPLRDLGICRLRLRQGALARDGDHGAQLPVDAARCDPGRSASVAST